MNFLKYSVLVVAAYPFEPSTSIRLQLDIACLTNCRWFHDAIGEQSKHGQSELWSHSTCSLGSWALLFFLEIMVDDSCIISTILGSNDKAYGYSRDGGSYSGCDQEVHGSPKTSTSTTAKKISKSSVNLDGQPFDLVTHRLDRPSQLTALVGRNAGCNHRARDSAGSSQRRLARQKYVRNSLVLAEKRDMQEDFDGSGVGAQQGNFANAAVEGLCD